MSKCNVVGTMGLHLTMCIVVNRKLTPPIHRPQRYHGCSQVLFMRLKRSWPSREAWHVPVTSRATKVGRGICNKRDKWCFIPRRTAYVKYCAPAPCSFWLKPSTYLFAFEDRFLCWHVFAHYRSASTNNEAACRDWSAPRASGAFPSQWLRGELGLNQNRFEYGAETLTRWPIPWPRNVTKHDVKR